MTIEGIRDKFVKSTEYRGKSYESWLETQVWSCENTRDVKNKIIKDLKCCGNCKKYFGCGKMERLNGDATDCCENWTFDDLKSEERKINE